MDEHGNIYLANPLDMVPPTPKIILDGQRKREISVSPSNLQPDNGWTNNQLITFILNSDVGFLDLKHMVLRMKFAQRVVEEKMKVVNVNLNYCATGHIGDLTPPVFNTETSYSNLKQADTVTKRCKSLFDLELGTKSLFKEITIKINDKTYYKMEEIDRLKKFIYFQTAVNHDGMILGNVESQNMAYDPLTGTNFDLGALHYYDVVVPFSSLFDEFPLFPLYKIVGDIKIEFLLNSAERAYVPSLQPWKYTGLFDCTKPAANVDLSVAANRKPSSIQWTSQPKFEFFVKDVQMDFLALEMLDSGAKDFNDLSEHFLLNRITYRDFVFGSTHQAVKLDFKSPSIRYVWHALINRASDNLLVPTTKYFNLVDYANYELEYRPTPVPFSDLVLQGLMLHAQSTTFNLNAVEMWADIGNLKYPSDRRYEGELDIYLQKLLEFYEYNARDLVTNSPIVRYKYTTRVSALSKLRMKAKYYLTTAHTLASTTNPSYELEDGIGLEVNTQQPEPLQYYLNHQVHPKFDPSTAIFDGANLSSVGNVSGRSSYFWNFSKMVQKRNSILGMLNSQFNDVWFHFTLEKAYTKNSFDSDLQFLQVVSTDAKQILNAATGNMELFI